MPQIQKSLFASFSPEKEVLTWLTFSLTLPVG
jgi:hypothetical protein